ncbi:hypothetical protein A4G20_07340 [Pasteurellaceae bacterium RH1A]|nr:hypothetical protein A4G20_07340 [Pasteurellaceae bacterium RH1A]
MYYKALSHFLATILSTMPEEIKNNLDCIIIAEDSGGNFFLLDKLGKVYYWNRTFLHEYSSNKERKVPISSSDEENDPVLIYVLFNDFNDFFALVEAACKAQNSSLKSDNL